MILPFGLEIPFWFLFGVIMPAIVAGGGWLLVLQGEREAREFDRLRAEEEARKRAAPAE